MAITVILGKYAIEEGQRAERQKKFMKNMNEFTKKSKNKHVRKRQRKEYLIKQKIK